MRRYSPYSSVAPSRSASSDPRSPRIPALSTTPSRNVTFGRSIRRSLHYNSYEDVAAFSPLSSPFTNVLTSPVSDSGAGAPRAETPRERLPSSRVTKAIDNATSSMVKAEASFAELIAMRDQQARFINQQETILTMLELESDKLDSELYELQKEMLQLESDISHLKKSKLEVTNNVSVLNVADAEDVRGGFGQTIRYKLRHRRSKA